MYNNTSERLNSVDMIKGICILIIVLTHAGFSQCERNMAGFPFWVDMAVPMFMIVSGYVSSYSFYRNNIDSISKAYSTSKLVKRFGRFLIPYFPIYMIYVAFELSGGVYQ